MKELWIKCEGGFNDGHIKVSLKYDDIDYSKIVNDEYTVFMPIDLLKANCGLALVPTIRTPESILQNVIDDIENNNRVKTSGDYSFQAGIDVCLNMLYKQLYKLKE